MKILNYSVLLFACLWLIDREPVMIETSCSTLRIYQTTIIAALPHWRDLNDNAREYLCREIEFKYRTNVSVGYAISYLQNNWDNLLAQAKENSERHMKKLRPEQL